MSMFEHLHNRIDTLTNERNSAREKIARLSGKLCLVCGSRKPCKEAPDACTFDLNPIQAAQEFLARAVKAEAEVERLARAGRGPIKVVEKRWLVWYRNCNGNMEVVTRRNNYKDTTIYDYPVLRVTEVTEEFDDE